MKPKKILFTLFMYCSTTLLYSGCNKPDSDEPKLHPLEQTITPGKIWHIESGYPCLEGDGTGCFCYNRLLTIKVGNTRTFNGKVYYELFTDEPTGFFPDGYIITYVREEGKKVFFYAEYCDQEYLMYDFDMNVGDEVFLADPRHPTFFHNQQYNPCELTESDIYECQYKVIEVDSIEYNQVKRKMLKLVSNFRPYSPDIWVEGIGGMRGITFCAATHSSGVKQLKNCYKSDELIFVNENPEFCWIFTSMTNKKNINFKNTTK